MTSRLATNSRTTGVYVVWRHPKIVLQYGWWMRRSTAHRHLKELNAVKSMKFHRVIEIWDTYRKRCIILKLMIMSRRGPSSLSFSSFGIWMLGPAIGALPFLARASFRCEEDHCESISYKTINIFSIIQGNVPQFMSRAYHHDFHYKHIQALHIFIS